MTIFFENDYNYFDQSSKIYGDIVHKLKYENGIFRNITANVLWREGKIDMTILPKEVLPVRRICCSLSGK
jgi:hypothetical protein